MRRSIMSKQDHFIFPYFRYIETCNEFEGEKGKTWLFYPGMTFGSWEKWWPDRGFRPTAHEGLDICYFTDNSGLCQQVNPNVNIPVMTGGTIIGVCKDFLGSSVFLQHDTTDPEGLISVYAHIIPKQTIFPGSGVVAGEVIGNIADTSCRKNMMPAHLHITIMKITAKNGDEYLDWNFICNSDRIILFDPLQMFGGTAYEILPRIDY
jgi:hypothetical protein